VCGHYVRRSDKQRIAEHFQVHGPSPAGLRAELRMVEITKIPEKKAPLKRSWKTTATSKVQPALSGKVPDEPVAAPAKPDNTPASAHNEP
jgi:hypothetical protein